MDLVPISSTTQLPSPGAADSPAAATVLATLLVTSHASRIENRGGMGRTPGGKSLGAQTRFSESRVRQGVVAAGVRPIFTSPTPHISRPIDGDVPPGGGGPSAPHTLPGAGIRQIRTDPRTPFSQSAQTRFPSFKIRQGGASAGPTTGLFFSVDSENRTCQAPADTVRGRSNFGMVHFPAKRGFVNNAILRFRGYLRFVNKVLR